MKINMSIIRFTVAAIIVMVLGALAGWYLFVSRQVDSTAAQDQARGFGRTASFGSSIGSALSNLLGRDAGSNEALGITDESSVDGGFSLGGVIGDGITNVLGDIVGNMMGNEATNPVASNKAPRTWVVSKTPVAGFGFASSSAKIYFAERSSGNILSADPETAAVERLTNTLIPKVHEAIFARDGSVVLRSISDGGQIVSFAATMATNTSPAAGDTVKKLEGTYLPENILSIASRPGTKELFFILREGDGSAAITSNWLGGAQKRLFSSALSDWTAIQLQDGTRYVLQKASDDTIGYAYSISSAGSLEKIAGLSGLSILPRSNSSALLYSSVESGAITLYARASSGAPETRLPVRTIAEKCVWSPDTRLIAYCAVPQTTPARGYLRRLYDGSGHTTDGWWRIDVSANTAEQIFTPDASISFDAESPAMDSSGTHIGFINSADKSLWLLRIQP